MDEASPTRRRWLQFSLGTLLLAMTVFAVGFWWTKDWWLTDPDAFVVVAVMQGNQRVAERTLNAKGIECQVQGPSSVYSISVARRNADQARDIIRNSNKLCPQVIKIENGDRVAASRP